MTDEFEQMTLPLPYEVLSLPKRAWTRRLEKLRRERSGHSTVVVIGSDDQLERVEEGYNILTYGISSSYTTEEAISWSEEIEHPKDLLEWAEERIRMKCERAIQSEREHLASHGTLRESTQRLKEHWIDEGVVDADADPLSEQFWRRLVGPTLRSWPEDAAEMYGYYAPDDCTGQVNVVVIPTPEAALVPAFLKSGGFNDCPHAPWHVAAFRSWHARYGAIPVEMGRDLVNLRVERRPETREEALALAREHAAYCCEIRDLSHRAAALMVSDWWYFWWD